MDIIRISIGSTFIYASNSQISRVFPRHFSPGIIQAILIREGITGQIVIG
jgi:hypothetical protein